MSFLNRDDEIDVNILKYVVMVAIIAGALTVAAIYIQAKSESYSALYIDSYSNYIENGTVSFTYGVDRFGPSGESYEFKVLHRGKTMFSENFQMEPGTRKMDVSFPLNETIFPVKIQLVLKESSGAAYEVYFWLKG